MSFLKKFKNRRLQIYLGIAIIICICLGVLSFIDKKKNVSDIQENITETYTIPESEKIFINGSVVPKQSKDFDVPAGAELSSVSVQDGQEVSKGALLFTSKNESIVTQIDGLKSQVEQLKKQKDIDVDKRKIILEEPIRVLGSAKVEIKIHPKVTTKIRVDVKEKQ